MTIAELSPGLVLILGALLIPVLPGKLRNLWMVVLPVLGFWQAWGIGDGLAGQIEVMGLELTTMRMDDLARTFGYVFLLAAFLGAIYSFHRGGWVEHTTGMLYAGSAIGAVFAGDLVTLFLFWEGTAITSVFLIWARGTERAYHAGMRYLVVQVGSGVLLLAGAMVHVGLSGETAFDSFDPATTAGALILLAFAIKAALPLVHTWLPDAYPEATVTGTVMLSAFTTKLAIYAMVRGYAGMEILLPIGAAMTVYPLFFALLANDLRRVLAYAQMSGLGFMVAGIGMGTELALSGVIAYAVCSLIYLMTFYMATGAVLMRVGTAKASALGGLYRSMPWTTLFCCLAAAAIMALPLFSGFVSKSLILSAAMKDGHFVPWLALMFSTVGLILVAGLKVPYTAFFGQDSGLRPKEAPVNMLLAMGLGAAISIVIGVAPGVLYALLPYDVSYDSYTLEHIVTQMQMVLFAALAYVVLARMGVFPAKLASVHVDVDWLWRRPAAWLMRGLFRWLSDWWTLISGNGLKAGAELAKELYRQHGPTGTLARTRPSGSMALWMAALLFAFMAFSFL